MSADIEKILQHTKRVKGNLTLLELLGEMVRQFQLNGKIQLKRHELSRRNVERLAKFDNDGQVGLTIYENDHGYEVHTTPGYLHFVINDVLTSTDRRRVLSYRGDVDAYAPTAVRVREIVPKSIDEEIVATTLLNGALWDIFNENNRLWLVNRVTLQRHEIRLVPAHLDLGE